MSNTLDGRSGPVAARAGRAESGRSLRDKVRSALRDKPPLDFLPLLTQHSFAGAEVIFWQCSEVHQTSYSGGALQGIFKPTFRSASPELASCGTKLANSALAKSASALR